MTATVDYTIVGKNKEDGQTYHIYVCGKNKEHAEEILEKAKADKKVLEKYTDIIIQEHISTKSWPTIFS